MFRPQNSVVRPLVCFAQQTYHGIMLKTKHIAILLAALFINGLGQPATAELTYDKKMQLGQLLYFNGNIEQSIKAFLRAAELKPDAFEPHLNLVNIFVQKGELQLAIIECRNVLKRKPAHREVRVILGNLLASVAGDEKDGRKANELLQEAIVELERGKEPGADRAMVDITIARAKAQQGHVDDAMTVIENVLKENPNFPDALSAKALLLWQKGDKEQALYSLELVLKSTNGRNALDWETKGALLDRMGRFKDAVQCYARAEKLYRRAGKLDEALECLKRIRALEPEESPAGDFDWHHFPRWSPEKRLLEPKVRDDET